MPASWPACSVIQHSGEKGFCSPHVGLDVHVGTVGEKIFVLHPPLLRPKQSIATGRPAIKCVRLGDGVCLFLSVMSGVIALFAADLQFTMQLRATRRDNNVGRKSCW
jgi:hypothetical protein